MTRRRTPIAANPAAGSSPLDRVALDGPAWDSPPFDLFAVADLRASLLAWYAETGRSLPFRGTRDPWAILVAEVMAHQTQAERAGAAWASFMARFPTAATLAAAEPADVLRAWRGLGYNRRALALQQTAIRLETEHGGRVPDDLLALEALPGIGLYTARAVAAVAFGRPVGAVDTNVRRVIRRLVGRPLPPRELQALADALVDPTRSGDWTHALMDVGAGVCRPVRPRCGECPVRAWCTTAAAAGDGTTAGDATAASVRARSRTTAGSRSRPATPFPATTRWLRGRIVDRLRDADGDGWARLDAPLGVHDELAVRRAIAGLVADGLVEGDPTDGRRARLPRGGTGPREDTVRRDDTGPHASGGVEARTLDAP